MNAANLFLILFFLTSLYFSVKLIFSPFNLIYLLRTDTDGTLRLLTAYCLYSSRISTITNKSIRKIRKSAYASRIRNEI